MGDILKLLLEVIRPWWHQRIVAIGLPILVGAIVYMAMTIESTSAFDRRALAYAIVAAFLVSVVWIITNRIPKVSPGRVGIVIAATSDDEAEGKRIRYDFVRELSSLLRSDSEGSRFQVVVLPEFASQRVVHHHEGEKFLQIARGHLMLYGFSRRRSINGDDTHLLELEGIIRHAPLPEKTGKLFGSHFRSVLPKSTFIPIDNDALAFRLASQMVNLTSRYIIGIAAHMSGDLAYAERMYLDSERLLGLEDPIVPIHEPLAKQLPLQIKDLYRAWIDRVYFHYFGSRDEKHVKDLDILSDKLLEREKSDYAGLLTKAICHFVLRRDTRKAFDVLEGCRRIRDTTWRYSLAFLHAYECDLDKAHELYRDASRRPLHNQNVPIQSEEFIYIVLAKEPNMKQLHFCLGLINYNMKKDYQIAKVELESFLKWEQVEKFPSSKALAENLLQRCRLHIDGTPAGIAKS